ncbi:MAG: alpha-D-ribose 1-methylphosphonate 5-triphosphate diphosphatase [Alphaproteobacteria bacterium]|nr:alpha-D-ribose 1-methylphosphonate 5-triphosphate diphosphatase [Alphaproteobacteria bacterium]MCB9930107.1 alpha-D-ribose 1-methylphosphonate 5-triphosphate diphosphatase [Alphaproteobacteria bacterium]
MSETTLTNARLVLRDRVMSGALAIRDGRILAIGTDATQGQDLEGDYLIPGLVELHTDNIEKNLRPRPGITWPSALAAILAHDAACAGAGITTVYDSISVGEYSDAPGRREFLQLSVDGIKQGMAADAFRAEHRLHLRCELPDPGVLRLLEPYWDEPLFGLISLMDHTPGQRQWRDMESYRVYLTPRLMPGETFERRVADRIETGQKLVPIHRREILARWRAKGADLPVASHDDTTLEHVAEAAADGIAIAEFPTTLEAAKALHAAKIGVVMGAPNVVRGGSHSGNVSAMELAHEGLVDGLSSDYAPFSLLHAAFLLHERAGLPLSDAIATVTAAPAAMAGLRDRGSIAEGRRADLVQVRLVEGVPVVRAVWREGRRVA